MTASARPGFTGLVGVLPPRRPAVATLARDLGLDHALIERLGQGGLRHIPVDAPRPLAALVTEALKELARQTGSLSDQVALVLLAHSVTWLAPGGCDPLTGALEAVGLASVPRIFLSGQPCAIFHFALNRALDLLGDLPAGQGILVIGADKAWRDEDRFFFGSAMGEGVVAGVLTAQAASHRLLGTGSQSLVVACQGEDSPAEAIARFRAMSPLQLRQVVERVLAEAGHRIDDLAWIAPHTPYLAMWDTMCAVLRFPRERVLTRLLPETGHLNSNDSVYHYLRAANEGIVRPDDLVLLVNPGFGGTWGCTLIQY